MKAYQIEFDYIWRSAEVKEQAMEVRRQSFSICGIKDEPGEDGKAPYNSVIIITQEQLLAITELNEAFKIVKTLEVTDPLHSTVERFERAVEKLSALPDRDIAYNEKCEVHVPNMALMTYNETMLLEDSCTDELQNKLDEGWRIVACCPQAQRRPDYIMGRYNPDRGVNELGSHARRG